MAKKKSKKTSNGMFATACVLLAIILVAIVFLVKKDKILSNYKDTGFFERIFGKNPEFVEKHEDKNKETVVIKDDEIVIDVKEEPSVTKTIQDKVQTVVEDVENKINEGAKKAVEEKITEAVKNPVSEEKPAKEEEKTKQEVSAKSDYQLCFIKIDADGKIIRKIVKRTAAKSQSPLTTAINYLIEGPDTSLSAEKDCMSFIPKGTKLLGARVSDGVAYLNFNENFEFNGDGVEGTLAQVMQIVYTATAFSTVNSVQILIEGKIQPYLGSEGIEIGSPISRGMYN